VKREIEDRLNRSEIQVGAKGPHYCMFLRDGCLAVVPCDDETFGAIGSTGLAVDQDGSLYVCDTLNNRIEIFDADGKFISTFGKAGDGPGHFARPKGVAIDSDGHVWVADGMQDRVQVFNKEAQLLITFGGHGLLPGQFQGLVGITTDKNNRVFTSEMYPGRVQQFRYVTDAEAEQLGKDRETQRVKKAATGTKEPVPELAPSTDAKRPQSK